MGLKQLKWGISLYCDDQNFIMLSNVTKKMWWESDVMKQLENPVAGTLWLWCLNVHGKCFPSKARIQKFSKLIEISCLQVMKKQTDNHTFMLDMLHLNMSVVCTYHCRGVFHEKYFLVWLLFFVAKKAGRGTELQFLCTQGTL